MAADINDKFKKVSADNSYAVATTVKTARTVGGGTTLEAFDLSKWADATAVNFLTYRKTTDPVTNVTTITNRTGWTALVNTGSNTLTNLTIAPGYTDLGQQVGDYIEPVQMSKWANDLVDGILVTHNQDGTLKNKIATLSKINGGTTAGALTTDASGVVSPGGNYSTSEVATNTTWVDGKMIYKKTVNFGNMPSSTTKNVAHGVTGIDRFIKYETSLKDTTNDNSFPLPFVRASGGTDNMELRLTPTNITVTTNSANFVNFSAYITIYYTKV